MASRRAGANLFGDGGSSLKKRLKLKGSRTGTVFVGLSSESARPMMLSRGRYTLTASRH